MTEAVQSSNPPAADLIDRIANALPAEQRADFYREMRHCRSLPENDEMLRILRSMMFLTQLMVDVPNRVVVERQRLEALFTTTTDAVQSATESSLAWQKQLDEGLRHLPEDIARGIRPEAIVAKINESLRQQFVQSTIPQTAQALTVIGADMRKTTDDFRQAADGLGQSYGGAAEQARKSIRQIELTVSRAADSARQAAQELSRVFRQEYRWSLYTLSGLALLIGLVLGALFQQWVDAPALSRKAGVAIEAHPK